VRTPLEKSYYKTTWMGEASCVDIHIDDLDDAISWCKENVSEDDWHVSKFTEEYGHRVHFKFESDAKKFETKA